MTPRRPRATKRNLVRWTDDLDKEVLLVVQYACAEAGIKIPWARVAEVMGPHFTEGAIVQHLAKLRTLMAKHEIPVPPSLKRGMLTKTPSKVYGNATPRRTFESIEPLYAGSPNASGGDTRSVYERAASIKVEESGSPTPQLKGRMRTGGRARNMSDDEEDEDLLPETLYDSEASPKKKRRTTKTKKASATIGNPPATPEQAVKGMGESSISTVEQTTGPSRRTRGIKRDYTLMDPAFDDMDADVDQDDADTVADNDGCSNFGEETTMPEDNLQDNGFAAAEIDMMTTANVSSDLPHIGADIFGGTTTNINAPNVDPFTGVSGWPSATGLFDNMSVASFPPGTVNGAALFKPNGFYNPPQMSMQTYDMPMALASNPMDFAPELFRQYSVDSSYQTSRNDSVATGMTSFTTASGSQQERSQVQMPAASTFKVDDLDNFNFDHQEKPAPSLNEHWNDAFAHGLDEFANNGQDFNA